MNIENIGTIQTPPRSVSAPVSGHGQTNNLSRLQPGTHSAASAVTPNTQDNASRSSSDLSVEEAVKRLSSFVPSSSEINFSIDEDSGVRVVKVLDSKSNEVIRQIPSEEAIEIARALDKLQGLFIKDKA